MCCTSAMCIQFSGISQQRQRLALHICFNVDCSKIIFDDYQIDSLLFQYVPSEGSIDLQTQQYSLKQGLPSHSTATIEIILKLSTIIFWRYFLWHLFNGLNWINQFMNDTRSMHHCLQMPAYYSEQSAIKNYELIRYISDDNIHKQCNAFFPGLRSSDWTRNLYLDDSDLQNAMSSFSLTFFYRLYIIPKHCLRKRQCLDPVLSIILTAWLSIQTFSTSMPWKAVPGSIFIFLVE